MKTTNRPSRPATATDDLSRRDFLKTSSAAVATPVAMKGLQEAMMGAAPWEPTTDKKIRMGVVGGGFGRSYHWHQHPNCIVEAVSDLIPERRTQLMKTYECEKSYESLEQLILDPNIDGVGVFTGAPDHARHVIACMEHGKHVISACPACVTLEEAAAMKEVKERTVSFQRRDYERHGPLALRYMKLRLGGMRRHRRSPSAALRTRARGFRNDLMFSVPGAAVGKELGPNPLVRADFAAIQRTIRCEVPLLDVVLDALRGRASPGGLLRLLLFTHPLTEPLARWVVISNALRWDPRTRDRCRTLGGLLKHRRAAMDEVRRGMMPWDQPRTVHTRYPLEEEEEP